MRLRRARARDRLKVPYFTHSSPTQRPEAPADGKTFWTMDNIVVVIGAAAVASMRRSQNRHQTREWPMSGNFLVHVIAFIGWLIAAVFAYAFITLFGYFGVGFY